MPSRKRQKGFTLIEVIASLVLLGIMMAVAGMGIVAGVRGYLLARENAVIAQKAHLTLGRLTRELQECYDCSGSPGLIALPFSFSNPLGSREINLNGTNVTLGGITLVDQVEDFSLSFNANGRIVINLTLAYRATNAEAEFQTTVLPRNTFF